MSIINNANSGSSISLLCLIDRYLLSLKKKPVHKQVLQEVCRPDNLPKSDNARKKFHQNLTFWIEQGLWLENEDGIYISDDSALDSNLPTRVLKICIEQCRNTDITDKDKITIEPLLRCLACLLAQNKFAFGGELLNSGQGGIDLAVNNLLPIELAINRSNESSTLRDYAEFLGFIEPMIGENGYLLDPTRAIQAVLVDVFDDSSELAVNTFIDRLAEKIPILDRGVHRVAIERLMQEKGWEQPIQNALSASLSYALVRLEMAEIISMSTKSDDAEQLNLNIKNTPRAVSRIVLRKGNL